MPRARRRLLALLCGSLSICEASDRAVADVPKPRPPIIVRSVDPKAFPLVPNQGIGPLRGGMTRAEIDKVLKPEEIGEGEEGGKPGISAYFLSPEKRIFIRLDAQGKVVALTLHGDRSKWRDARGITLGTTLDALEKLNGKPFRFHGFDDSAQAGQILDWGGGALAKDFAKAKLIFASPIHARDYGKLSAAQKVDIEKPRDFQSNDAAMRKLNPIVETIELTF